MEYSTIKRNDVLIHAATWMNLKDISPSKISQTQDKCVIPVV